MQKGLQADWDRRLSAGQQGRPTRGWMSATGSFAAGPLLGGPAFGGLVANWVQSGHLGQHRSGALWCPLEAATHNRRNIPSALDFETQPSSHRVRPSSE